MIPLCLPTIGEEEIKAVSQALASGWLTDGPKNQELEENFAKYIGTKRAVSVNSCASALFLTLKALGIKGQVIIPSFTFTATANAVVTAGASPVYADINPATGNIDPDKLESLITSETEAVMPVHFAGQSCRMDKILEICQKHKLALIEDSAEAIGAKFKNKMTGSFGIGCFSFFPTKNMTTGEGGIITTDDDALANKIKTLAAHGIPRDKSKTDSRFWRRSATEAGYNFRLSNILAALGVEQLKKLDKMNDLRRQHASYLNQRLNKEKIILPLEDTDCYHVYQMYTIQVDPQKRDELVLKLKANDIAASVHFDPPVHLQDFYQKNYPNKISLPQTELLAQSILTLPMYPNLSKDQLDQIIETVNKLI